MPFRPLHARPHTLYLLSSIRRFRRHNPFTIPLRTVPIPVLCFISKGTGVVHINDMMHRIEPLQLLFLNPGMTIEATFHSKDIEYFMIIMNPITITRRKSQWQAARNSEIPPLPPGLVSISDGGQVLECVQQLYDSSQSKDCTSQAQLKLDLQFQELLGFIMRNSDSQQRTSSLHSGIDHSIDYMNKHFQDKISRETLSKIAQLTPNAFCRSFKKVTGTSPTDYLNRIRIQQAKEKLGPDCSVKEVAAAVGYGSEYYFSRIFKETVGLSPSLFIKRERLRVATASRVYFQDNLSSIGMNPVASVDCYRYPGMDEAEYNRRMASQMEQLRLAKPDLIIADYFHTSLYDALKEFAPTVIIKHHLDWRVAHMNIAELVGREQEAVQTFNQLDERVMDVRHLLQASTLQTSVTILQIVSTSIRIQGTVHHPLNDLLYKALGMNPGDAVPRNKMREECSIEELPAPQTDHLFIIKQNHHLQVEELWDQLQQAHYWGSIRAVIHQQVHFVQNWLLMSWTPQGRNRILDDIIRILVR
ncbi:helix-turn-helix domain-containing protein [Paenibacillus sp. WQ 127069]|uniref:Helix-turn-helix domain-containing protein n=1 Tax=Paenibacillus baimaensis TaxID=2982185 RepID=A0ABT2UFZ1_9BACL|nr:helix-turn-helix domain-containing protein [Paenibacillus sp. WQ 127069]MCU6793546.1 helix-turn-helix domain-containing protein [Paenibacillus sp. WQ 127069]